MSSNYSHMLPGVLREGKPFNRAITFFDDFVGGQDASTTNFAQWVSTLASGTVAIGDAHGGVATLTMHSTAAEQNLQANGEAFQLAAGRRIIFEAKFRVDDAAAVTFFAGLAITDTSPLATVSDFVGLAVVANGGPIRLIAAKDSAAAMSAYAANTDDTVQASTGESLVTATDVVVRFEAEGLDRIKAYVNGVYKCEIVPTVTSGTITKVPDNELLTPTIAWLGGNSDVMLLDYVLCVADR